MQTFFLVCAALGGVVLVLQLVLGLAGIVDLQDLGLDLGDHDLGAHEAHDGLDLLGVRALAAGSAFFGVGGLFGLWLGVGALGAVPIALMIGGAALVGTAWAVRQMRRLEADGTPLLEEAIGERGTVYLTIPGREAGEGKVHVPLRGRLAELPAVTLGDELPTGTAVVVTDVIRGETLVVALNILPSEVDDVPR